MFIYSENHKPIEIKKGKTKIVLDLGIGIFNPNETRERGLFKQYPFACKPWLQYEDKWYYIKDSSRYDSLENLANDFKREVYCEEHLLEKIFNHVSLKLWIIVNICALKMEC